MKNIKVSTVATIIIVILLLIAANNLPVQALSASAVCADELYVPGTILIDARGIERNDKVLVKCFYNRVPGVNAAQAESMCLYSGQSIRPRYLPGYALVFHSFKFQPELQRFWCMFEVINVTRSKP